MRFTVEKLTALVSILILTAFFAFGQSRNNAKSTADFDGSVLSVTAARANSTDPIKVENLFLDCGTPYSFMFTTLYFTL